MSREGSHQAWHEYAGESAEQLLDSRLEACDQAYFSAGEDIAAALMGHLDKHRDELRLL
jgi:hypothetical protein